jgi:hypothetical protein
MYQDTQSTHNNKYTINTQKSIDFLYMDNKHTEKEIRKTIPFTIISEKYLGINLWKTSIMKTIKQFSFKLKKEIEEHTRRWKCFPYL